MENEKTFAKRWLMVQPFLLALACLYAFAYLACERAGLSLFHCRIASRFGIYCPGCGGSRAVVALLSGRILRSFLYHPSVLISAACLAFYDAHLSLFLLGRGRMPSRRLGLWLFGACIASVIVGCAIKNALLFCGIDVIGDIL